MTKKRIYVAGAGGMLGEAFYKLFKDEFDCVFSDKDLNSDWLSFIDFRDANLYEENVILFKPDILVHLGAYTSLEYCDLNELDALNNNVVSVETAVKIANTLNIPLLFISTAGIFDGQKEEYDDWDAPAPLGVYARTKVIAEDYIQKNSTKYYIMRAGWMMGGGPGKDKKFVGKIIGQLRSGVRELHIVNDKDGTPTYTHDFARVAYELLSTDRFGVYNCVCEGLTSRLEVAREIVKILGLSSEVVIHEVSSDYFANEYFSLRPPSERLINKKLKIIGLNKMRDWKIALNEYINEYF
jgi:dTDP-4-dehydrorhamnose reductase